MNRTELRHRLLTAVKAGQVTILAELSFTGAASRSLSDLRKRAYVKLSGSPRELTEDGAALLDEWDEKYGPVTP